MTSADTFYTVSNQILAEVINLGFNTFFNQPHALLHCAIPNDKSMDENTENS